MKRHAILIGSSRFDREPKLQPLKCPENDVDGIYDIVSSLGGFDESFVFKNADHQAILNQIEDTLREAHADDQLLLYYSGHGETDMPGRLYLTASDTEVKRLFATSIPVETLRTMIEHYQRRKIMLILDCCFGGAAGKSFVKGSVDEQLKQLSRGSGVYILTASTAMQTALEKEGDEYSLLTKHIIHGVRTGEAANATTGLVTMEDLYRYVYARVKAEGHQEPMHWALNVRGEDLVIARAVKNQLDRLRELDAWVLQSASLFTRKVRIRAQQVIDDCQAQPDLHASHIRLLEALFEKQIEIGEFNEEWERVEAPRQERPVAPPPKPAPRVEAPSQPPHAGSAAYPAAAQSFIEDLNGARLEMIYVPAGRFTMGSDRENNEKPPHPVNVPAYYAGKYQITQKQWKAMMGTNPSRFKGDDLPVERVSWNDAQEFCKKLQQLTKKAYRLPSEAEWEYACRAGTTGDYAGELEEMAWYHDNSEGKTHPVGQKQPNAFGLYDMHGNVWEWCEDVWHGNYKGAPYDGSSWLSEGDSSLHVLRGGSWFVNIYNCRSACRDYNRFDAFIFNFGFRVVVSARKS